MKDILVYFSDQHSGRVTGFMGDPIVRTPNMDRLASQGTYLKNAYTSGPLCVPARMSFLTGQLPSRTGIVTNGGILPYDVATYMHSLGAAGYETVLCGRMHFTGEDQRHGFTKRIAGDITPFFSGYREMFRSERKEFMDTLQEGGSLELIGGGTSPTLEFDRYVVQSALDYLQGDYERPQFICVGTYAPHFPYVAPPELFDYYYDKVQLPPSVDGDGYEHPVIDARFSDNDHELVRAARAAYYGMVEFTDQCVGKVYDQFQEYLKRTGREGVFIYMSDHGDQCGERGFYGKTTFFESSAHIPVIFCGDGIPSGGVIDSPTSIMDIGPTLCQMAGAPLPPYQDGKSLFQQIQTGAQDPERYVLSDILDGRMGKGVRERVPGRMVVWKQYKLMTYAGYESYDLLFDLEQDPWELRNIASEQPDLLEKMRAWARLDWDPAQILERDAVHEANMRLISQCVREHKLDHPERWRCPGEKMIVPEHYYKSKKYEAFKKAMMERLKAR